MLRRQAVNDVRLRVFGASEVVEIEAEQRGLDSMTIREATTVVANRLVDIAVVLRRRYLGMVDAHERIMAGEAPGDVSVGYVVPNTAECLSLLDATDREREALATGVRMIGRLRTKLTADAKRSKADKRSTTKGPGRKQEEMQKRREEVLRLYKSGVIEPGEIAAQIPRELKRDRTTIGRDLDALREQGLID